MAPHSFITDVLRYFTGDSLLSDLDPQWFRKKISLVGQEPVLFGITIAENIAYGRDATQEEVRVTARFSCDTHIL